jgi:hypothetical protein
MTDVHLGPVFGWGGVEVLPYTSDQYLARSVAIHLGPVFGEVCCHTPRTSIWGGVLPYTSDQYLGRCVAIHLGPVFGEVFMFEAEACSLYVYWSTRYELICNRCMSAA